MQTVVNSISKETVVKNSHIIRNMGTRGQIAKGSQLYDMIEIIHGYVISVILTKFRINANIELWQSFTNLNFDFGIVSDFFQYINPYLFPRLLYGIVQRISEEIVYKHAGLDDSKTHSNSYTTIVISDSFRHD